ncbi:hypothetical protein BC826DRAFT_523158 [Russula brevipes]|nr:hypothetical protein BC826DRAFT_523158 [Russula brevipes]
MALVIDPLHTRRPWSMWSAMCTCRLGMLSRSSWSADEVADGKGEGMCELKSLRGFDLFLQTGHVDSHSPTLPTSRLSLAPSAFSVDISLLPPVIPAPSHLLPFRLIVFATLPTTFPRAQKATCLFSHWSLFAHTKPYPLLSSQGIHHAQRRLHISLPKSTTMCFSTYFVSIAPIS